MNLGVWTPITPTKMVPRVVGPGQTAPGKIRSLAVFARAQRLTKLSRLVPDFVGARRRLDGSHSRPRRDFDFESLHRGQPVMIADRWSSW